MSDMEVAKKGKRLDKEVPVEKLAVRLLLPLRLCMFVRPHRLEGYDYGWLVITSPSSPGDKSQGEPL